MLPEFDCKLWLLGHSPHTSSTKQSWDMALDCFWCLANQDRDGCNRGFGQSAGGLLPIGDKKRKQIAAAGGNESSGGNHGIIGGDTALHSLRTPHPTQHPQVQPSSPKTWGDDDLGIFGQSHPALPWIRNRGDLGEISVRPINGSPGGRYLVVVLGRMTTLVGAKGFMMLWT